jgi:CRP-like cAMP-binding protein
VPILAPLTDDQRETVAASLTRKVFRAGELLIKQGDVGTEFIIIEAGEVVCIENKKVRRWCASRTRR